MISSATRANNVYASNLLSARSRPPCLLLRPWQQWHAFRAMRRCPSQPLKIESGGEGSCGQEV